MPLEEKLIAEDLLLVEGREEGGRIDLLVWVFPDEVLDNGLHEVLDAKVSVGLGQLQEAFLIGRPCLDDVSLRGEEAAHQDVVLEVVGELNSLLELKDQG